MGIVTSRGTMLRPSRVYYTEAQHIDRERAKRNKDTFRTRNKVAKKALSAFRKAFYNTEDMNTKLQALITCAKSLINVPNILTRIKRRNKFDTKWNYSCEVCGSKEHLHRHHLIPIYFGGRNINKNIITLCSVCHNKVHDQVDLIAIKEKANGCVHRTDLIEEYNKKLAAKVVV
jgi:5-methylcytosine-specific restriction endonuclease McrA